MPKNPTNQTNQFSLFSPITLKDKFLPEMEYKYEFGWVINNARFSKIWFIHELLNNRLISVNNIVAIVLN